MYKLWSYWWIMRLAAGDVTFIKHRFCAEAADWCRNFHWCVTIVIVLRPDAAGWSQNRAETAGLCKTSTPRLRCFILPRPKQTTIGTMPMMMAQTFSSGTRNTIMLHCSNGYALAQTIGRPPPPTLPPSSPGLIFMPGLHYEVQRKSPLTIWKNLRGRDAGQAMPHPHKEEWKRWQHWKRHFLFRRRATEKSFSTKHFNPLWV